MLDPFRIPTDSGIAAEPTSAEGRACPGLAVAVHRVHVGAELDQQLHRLQDVRLGAGRLLGRAHADAGRGQERGRALGVRQRRVGAQLDERFHQRNVRRGGRRQEGGRAGPVEDAPVRDARFRPQVHPGAVGDQLLDELKAGEFARADGRGVPFLVVAAARLAHPGDHV